MRLSWALLSVGIIALYGCTAPERVPGAAPVAWSMHEEGSRLTVTLIDAGSHYRVTTLVLTGPADERIEALEITRETIDGASASGRGADVGVGGHVGSGGRGGVRVGVSVPLDVGARTNVERRTHAVFDLAALPPAGRTGWIVYAAFVDRSGVEREARIPLAPPEAPPPP